jgi:hypothetical protein
VDDSGRVRGELTEEFGPMLRLYTEKGQERALLYVNHDNTAALMLLDNDPGSGRSAVVYAHDNVSGIELTDQRGARAGFELNNKKAGLQMIDEPPSRPKP